MAFGSTGGDTSGVRRALAGLVLAVAVGLGGQTAWAGPAFERIRERGALVVGLRVDAPPFASRSETGFVGFTVELCDMIDDAILEALGTPGIAVERVTVTAGDRFDRLVAGEIDVLCGATTVTLARRKLVDFSLPFFATGIGAVLGPGLSEDLRPILIWNTLSAYTATELERLFAGVRVGVRTGTTSELWLNREGPLAGLATLEREELADHYDGLARVAAGSLDVYVADLAILNELIRRSPVEGLEVTRASYTYEPYALGLPRDDADLRLVVDTALARLYRTGEILTLYERWFGEAPPTIGFFYDMLSLPE